MPTIITHAAVPLALGLGAGERVVSRRLLLAGIAASMLPDIDSLGFRFGISYGSPYGHRGCSHSFVLAGLLAFVASLIHRILHTSGWRAFVFVFASAASHGVLDAFTTGGRGVALLWPFANTRYFSPIRMIQVSPIGLVRFFSRNEVRVITAEMLWVWLPMLLVFLVLLGLRRSNLWTPHPARER